MEGWWDLLVILVAGRQVTTMYVGQQVTTMYVGQQVITLDVGQQVTTLDVGQQVTTLDVGQQVTTMDVGQQVTTMDVGQQVTTMDVGQQVTTMDVGQQVTTLDVGQQVTTMYVGQQVITLDVGQQVTIMDVGQQVTTMDVGHQVTTLDVGQQVTTLDVGQQVTTLDVGQQVTTLDVGQQVTTLDVGQQVTILDVGQQVTTLDVGQQVTTLDVGQQVTTMNVGQQVTTLDVRQLVTVALPCIIYLPDEKPRPSRPLPAAVQLRPRSSLPWTIYLEVTADGDTDEDTRVGCVVINATSSGTGVVANLGGCRNATLWSTLILSWPVMLSSGLLSVYTIIVTSAGKKLTVTLSGIANHTVQLDTGAKSVLVAGQSGQVSVAFPSVHKEGDCIILGAECTDNTFVMRVNSSVFLRPPTDYQVPVYVFLKQSECLDDIIFGELPVGKGRSGWAKLDVVYTRDDTNHTVSVQLSNTGVSVLSSTQPHHGQDCSDRWLRLGVSAASFSLDCDPRGNAYY
ncbi:uncharacterized protein [Procambarus clarkii]